jgi:hypothetical protein
MPTESENVWLSGVDRKSCVSIQSDAIDVRVVRSVSERQKFRRGPETISARRSKCRLAPQAAAATPYVRVHPMMIPANCAQISDWRALEFRIPDAFGDIGQIGATDLDQRMLGLFAGSEDPNVGAPSPFEAKIRR